MIMIVIFLGLLFAPSAGRLFKHDSKFARSLCRCSAPADCCFHAIKPKRLLRTCHACFYASAFPPTHEGRMHRSAPGCFCNSLLFCCVIVLHRSKQAVRPQQNLALNLELRIYKSLGYFAEPDSDWSWTFVALLNLKNGNCGFLRTVKNVLSRFRSVSYE